MNQSGNSQSFICPESFTSFVNEVHVSFHWIQCEKSNGNGKLCDKDERQR